MRGCTSFGKENTPMPFYVFFNDTATTEIYTLSLHDALPIYRDINLIYGINDDSALGATQAYEQAGLDPSELTTNGFGVDRKSTRLNSSHANISYAVFCLKKKKKTTLLHREVTPFSATVVGTA